VALPGESVGAVEQQVPDTVAELFSTLFELGNRPTVSVRAAYFVRYSKLPVVGQQLVDDVVFLRRQAD
jgi:hypothetical protein